jgi:septation ring formation regulator EzrA
VSRADAVHARIKDVERVADALFSEWKQELTQYSSADLRRASQKELDDTQGKYQALLAAMQGAEAKMQPVLNAFKDQVLFLKHNLNARAIASLQGNVAQIQGEVGSLIKDMEASIAEANTFISQMQKADAK